jgi:hypothetical protein
MLDCRAQQVWAAEETGGSQCLNRWPPASGLWVKMLLHSVYDMLEAASVHARPAVLGLRSRYEGDRR